MLSEGAMLKFIFFPSLILTFHLMAGVPTFYAQQAKHLEIDATKLYAIALANAGINNQFGHYQPWPWSVSINGNYYQFKQKGMLFEFLKKEMNSSKKINYGIAGILLKKQTTTELWQSLETDYQLSHIAKKLKRFNCSNLSQCVAKYRQSNVKIKINNNIPLKTPPHSSEELNYIIAKVSAETGIEQALIHAIVSQESAYKVYAKSHAGAMGLMQLMPTTATYLGLSQAEFYDPYKNLKAGANYIKEQLAAFGGKLDLALAAYNAGPGAVRKYRGIPPYEETKAYVPAVIGYYRYFKKKMG